MWPGESRSLITLRPSQTSLNYWPRWRRGAAYGRAGCRGVMRSPGFKCRRYGWRATRIRSPAPIAWRGGRVLRLAPYGATYQARATSHGSMMSRVMRACWRSSGGKLLRHRRLTLNSDCGYDSSIEAALDRAQAFDNSVGAL